LLQAEGAVDETCRNTTPLQGLHLVFHQGNQRRNDERHARKQQSGQLVTQGFAAARWHDSQHILASQDGSNDFLLACPKFLEAKRAVEKLERLGLHGVSR